MGVTELRFRCRPTVDPVPVTDNYFGTKIVDNYRWIEDSKSDETRAFIDAENAYTGRYMKQARLRQQVVDDLDDLENVSAASTPWQRGESYFFRKRLAGEQQFSIYVRQGWTGKTSASSILQSRAPTRMSRSASTTFLATANCSLMRSSTAVRTKRSYMS